MFHTLKGKILFFITLIMTIISAVMIFVTYWYLVVAAPVAEIQAVATDLVTRQVYAVAVICLGGIAAAFLLVSRISNPLGLLAEYARDLPSMDFTTVEDASSLIDELPRKYEDDVGRLAESLLFMKTELKKNVRDLVETIAAQERIEKEAAEASNRAKNEFLANMSHELRTPLNHIIGFTELVLNDHFGEINEEQRMSLSDVLQSSKHLLSLIDDILDLSKLEAGKLKLEVSVVDLRTLFSSSLTAVRETSLTHGVGLNSNIDGIPETVRVDRQKMAQIIENLLSNAVKFTPDGGEVTLGARTVTGVVRSGKRWHDPEQMKIFEHPAENHAAIGENLYGCLEVSVTDSGIGIAPEDQKRIFDAFEQVDSSASRRFQGTGLGLCLTRKLVELHGGKIWVESKGLSHGSTFKFIIPVCPVL